MKAIITNKPADVCSVKEEKGNVRLLGNTYYAPLNGSIGTLPVIVAAERNINNAVERKIKKL